MVAYSHQGLEQSPRPLVPSSALPLSTVVVCAERKVHVTASFGFRQGRFIGATHPFAATCKIAQALANPASSESAKPE